MALYGEISSWKILLKFFNFSLPRNFLQMFLNAFLVLLLVELNFALKCYSSNSCLICRTMKITSFIVVHLFWEIFVLNRHILLFIYPSLSHIFFYQTELDLQWRQIDFWPSPKARKCHILLTCFCFWTDWLFFLFSCGSFSLGCPIHIKSGKIYCIRLALQSVLL